MTAPELDFGIRHARRGAAPPPGSLEATGGTDLDLMPEVPRHPGLLVDLVAFPTREGYRDMVTAFHQDGFEMCADLCAVDYLTHPGRELPDGVEPERFEVVVNLLSMSSKRRVRVRVQVPEDEPVLPSLIAIYPGIDAMEREAFDMMGIRADGHPNLRRILMEDDWEGHPLRKDYPIGGEPVRFSGEE
jgi:NADH-quinone oxidoreductase subunit C